YYPEYTDDELEELGITVPDVEGQTVESAGSTLNALGLEYTVEGSGETVVSQVPAKASTLRRGGKVILYTDKNYETEYTTVPNVLGRSLSEVNTLLTNADLNFKAGDGASSHEGAVAYTQNYAEGCVVPKGTIIEVIFMIKDEG
ncbi:MAG: PASTA domain-containing protein, partial [Oscillospiraceae bacterium]